MPIHGEYDDTVKIEINGVELCIPAHKALVTLIAKHKDSLVDVSEEMELFIRRFQVHREETAVIDVGGVKVTFEIPQWLAQCIAEENKFKHKSLGDVDDFNGLLRNMLPHKYRPSTRKQISFAQTIAVTLGIDISNDVLESSERCSAFIERNMEAFNAEKHKRSYVLKTTRQGARGMVYTALCEDNSPAKAREIMGVRMEATTNKYVKNLIIFLDEFKNWDLKTKQISHHGLNGFLAIEYPQIDIEPFTLADLESFAE